MVAAKCRQSKSSRAVSPTTSEPEHWRPWEDKAKIEPLCCAYRFKSYREQKRHMQSTTKHAHQTEKCPDCSKQFTRKDNLTRHRKLKHDSEEKPKCNFCGKSLSRKDAVQRHEGTCHNNPNRQTSPSPPNALREDSVFLNLHHHHILLKSEHMM